MTFTVIVLSHTSYVGRDEMEGFENTIFENKNQFLETIGQSVNTDGIRLYTLTDFMDECNNEEIDISNYWFGYIQLKSMEGFYEIRTHDA